MGPHELVPEVDGCPESSNFPNITKAEIENTRAFERKDLRTIQNIC